MLKFRNLSQVFILFAVIFAANLFVRAQTNGDQAVLAEAAEHLEMMLYRKNDTF